MKLPLQITFRNLPSSEAITSVIREKAEKLDRFSDRIMSCRVMVEASHRHQHNGKIYHVRIDLTVPGEEIVVGRDPVNHAHEDVYVAIRDAFDSAKRQLQDHRRRVRGEEKVHEMPSHARVIRIFPDEGYGFIQTLDGREVYFHKNSVLKNGFEKLEVGDEVRFDEELGEKGPQASTVVAVGKSGHRHPELPGSKR
jgi:ribosomal subunit interface protein